MRILNFEFGLWTSPQPRKLEDYFEVIRAKDGCGCTVLTIGMLYFTILRGRCRKRR